MMKDKIRQKREARTKLFNQWQIFATEKTLQKAQIANEELTRKEVDLNMTVSELKAKLFHAEQTIRDLKQSIQEKDQTLSDQAANIREYKNLLSLNLPASVGTVMNNQMTFFSENPSVEKLLSHSRFKFQQLADMQRSQLVVEFAKPESQERKNRALVERKENFELENGEQLILPSVDQNEIFKQFDSKLDTEVMQSMKNPNRQHWYFQHLQNVEERIDLGGQGIPVMAKNSLDEILFRWTYFMIKKCLIKMRPLIEILETQLIKKSVVKKNQSSKWLCEFTQDGEIDQDYAQEQRSKSGQQVRQDFRIQNQLLNKGYSDIILTKYLTEPKLINTMNTQQALNLLSDMKGMYIRLKEFLSMKKDLDNDLAFGKSPLQIPEVILGIIFVLDTKFKVVQLDIVDVGDQIWNEVVPTKPPLMKPEDAGLLQQNAQGSSHMTKNKVDAAKLLQNVFEEQDCSQVASTIHPRMYQVPEFKMLEDFFDLKSKNRDEQFDFEQESPSPTGLKMQQHKSQSFSPQKRGNGQINSKVKQNEIQLQSLQQSSQEKREEEIAETVLDKFKFVLKQAERLTGTKLGFFIQITELMSTQTLRDYNLDSNVVLSSSLSNILSLLFLYKSKLNKPFEFKSPRAYYEKDNAYQEADLQDKRTKDADYKKILLADQYASDKLMHNVLYSILQVVHPIIIRTVNANMQDPLLLFSKEELKQAKKQLYSSSSKTEETENLGFKNLDVLERSNDELKLRWVNFILKKAFKTMKEREFKAAHLWRKIQAKGDQEKKKEEAAQAEAASKKSGAKRSKTKDPSNRTTPTLSNQPSRRNSIESPASTLAQMLVQSKKDTQDADCTGDLTDDEKICMDTTLKMNPVVNFQQLAGNDYVNLIALLGTLSPETIWHFFEMDQVSLSHGLDIVTLLVALIDPDNSACAKIVKHNLKQARKKYIGFKKKPGKRTSDFIFNENALFYQTDTNDIVHAGASSVLSRQLRHGLKKEFRAIFMINAVNRITSKNFIVSFEKLVKDELDTNSVSMLISELFCSRPRLNTQIMTSASQFQLHVHNLEKFIKSQEELNLYGLNMEKLLNLELLNQQLRTEKPKVMHAIKYNSHVQKLYEKVVQKFKTEQMMQQASTLQLAAARGLVRNHAYFCRLEKFLSTIDIPLLKHLIGFKSDMHATMWCSKIQGTILQFKYPLRRFMNFLSNSECNLTYFDIWRMIKHFNINGLNEINEITFQQRTNKMEGLLTKVAQYSQKRQEPESLNQVRDYEIKVKKMAKEQKAHNELMAVDDSGSNISEEDSVIMTRQQTLQPENYSPVESASKNQNGEISSLMKNQLLRKVTGNIGMAKNLPTVIKPDLLPKSSDSQNIFLNRRLLYDIRLSVREAMAVLIAYIFEIHLSLLLETFLAGGQTYIDKNSGKERSALLLIEDENQKKRKNDLQSKYDLQKSCQKTLQKFMVEITTGQNIQQLKNALAFEQSDQRQSKFVSQVQQSVMGNTEKCCPQIFFQIFMIKSILQRDESQLPLRKRHSMLMGDEMTTLIEFYKPLLMALFEYYLYESYQPHQRTQILESCLPLSAIKQFFSDFVGGESARINSTTATETIRGVLNLDPDVNLNLSVSKSKGHKGQKQSGSPKKKGQDSGNVDAMGFFITFADFVEIIFEISQEINIKRNITAAFKFKQYIESVIAQNIRYRLPMASPRREAEDSEPEEKKDNLHRKRLVFELDRSKPSDKTREAIKAANVASDTSIIDLM